MLYTLQPQQLLGADVFTRDCYKKILLDTLRHCQQSQGLQLHAWAPIAIGVTNHLHTICSCKTGKDFGDIWRNSKSFTAMKIIDAIIKRKAAPIVRIIFILGVFLRNCVLSCIS